MRQRSRAYRAGTHRWRMAWWRLDQLAKQRLRCHRVTQNSTLSAWDALLEGGAVGTSDDDGLARDPVGLIVCQKNNEEVWSRATQTHGYATLVVARELA